MPRRAPTANHAALPSPRPPAAVLHWGVRQAGRGADWLQPPLKLLTPESTLPMGGKSAETPFLACKGARLGCCGAGLAAQRLPLAALCSPPSPADPPLPLPFALCASCLPADSQDCVVDWHAVDFDPTDFDGAYNPLQRIKLQLPAGHGLAAIPFVIRSEDGAPPRRLPAWPFPACPGEEREHREAEEWQRSRGCREQASLSPSPASSHFPRGGRRELVARRRQRLHGAGAGRARAEGARQGAGL